MKLRNKKTGELVDAWSFYDGNESVNLKYFTNDGQVNLEYNSLAELNDEWEDYEPKEPLIKDEKIRKAVRAWAEANGLEGDYTLKYCLFYFTLTSWEADIEFNKNIEDLEDGKQYTITELCGDEE